MRRFARCCALLLVAVFVGTSMSGAARAADAVTAPSNVKFTFDISSVTVNGTLPPFVSEFSQVSNFCRIPGPPGSYMVIEPGGTLHGFCDFTYPSGTEHQFGTLTGTVNLATGAMTWEYDTGIEFTNAGVKTKYFIIFNGSTTIANGIATGTANYVLNRTCKGGGCEELESENYIYSGTIAYTVLVQPITSADLSVHHIEVVQVVQDDANTIPLVANKTTIARVFIAGSSPVFDATVTLKSNLEGQAVALDGGKALALPGTPIRSSEVPSVEFLLPPEWTTAGPITLEAEVQSPAGVSETNQVNNKKGETVTFQDRDGLFVDYIKVCQKLPADQQPRCPHGDVNQMHTFAADVLPLADGALVYNRLVLPVWIYEHELETSLDELFFLVAFRKRHAFMTSPSLADQVMAWLPPGLGISGGAADPAWDGGAGRVFYVQKEEDPNLELALKVAFAHELSHNLGRRHPNTPDACNAKDPHTDWQRADATTGEMGFWINGGLLMLDSYFDLMTYCQERWISPFTYKELFNTNFQVPSLTASRAIGRFAIISGSAKADGSAGTLDPVYQLPAHTAEVPVSDPAGSHCIRFEGAGQPTDFCFTLTFRSDASDTALDREPFALKLPMPNGTTRVSLRANGTELAAVTASSAAPSVAITFPAPGDALDDTETLTWNITDADSGTHATTVLYSPDGGATWLPIAVDEQDGSFTVDTNELAPGLAQFKVITTDGLNTAEETTGPIAILGVSGDLDCNGTIDLADALGAQQVAAGLATSLPCAAAADVDCDESPSANDAAAILRHLVGLPANLPQSCTPIGQD